MKKEEEEEARDRGRELKLSGVVKDCSTVGRWDSRRRSGKEEVNDVITCWANKELQ